MGLTSAGLEAVIIRPEALELKPMRNGSCSARRAEVTGRMLISSQRQQRLALVENARTTTDNAVAAIRSNPLRSGESVADSPRCR